MKTATVWAIAPEKALALIGERTLSPKDYASAMSAETLGETLTRVTPLAELVEAVKYHEHNAPIETNPCEICEKLAAVL